MDTDSKKHSTTIITSSFIHSQRSVTMAHLSFLRKSIGVILALVLLTGSLFGQNNLVISNGSTVTNSGTIRVKGNIDNTGVAGATTIGGTVELKGTTGQDIGTNGNGALNFTTLTATAVSTKTFNVDASVATALNITSAGATQFAVAASQDLTIGGTIQNTGGAGTPYDFDNSGAVVIYNGGAQSVFTTTYDGLTVTNAGSKSLGGSITVVSALTANSSSDLSIGANLLTVNGTYSVSGGATVTGGATSDLTLNGSGDIASFEVTGGLSDFILNRSNVVTLGADLTVADGFTITAGTLAVNTSTLTLNGAVTSSGTLTSAATGTVNYNKGTDVQNVLAASYGNLTFSSFAKTLPAGTVTVAGTFTPGASATHTITGNTFDFTGATQNVPSFNGATGYNNLTLSGAASTKTATGNLEIAGNFDNGGGSDNAVTLDMGLNTLVIDGTKDNSASTIKFAGPSNGQLFTTGTIEYSGTITQTIAGGGNYNILTFTGTGIKSIAAATTVGTNNDLSVPAGITLQLAAGSSTLNLNGTSNLTVAGTLDNAGVIEVGL